MLALTKNLTLKTRNISNKAVVIRLGVLKNLQRSQDHCQLPFEKNDATLH